MSLELMGSNQTPGERCCFKIQPHSPVVLQGLEALLTADTSHSQKSLTHSPVSLDIMNRLAYTSHTSSCGLQLDIWARA